MNTKQLAKFIIETAKEKNLSLIVEGKRKHHKKPHHRYKNASGHDIHIFIKKTKHGYSAHFHNKTLDSVEKTIHWSNKSTKPSKKEMELLENNSSLSIIKFLLEKKIESVDPDTAGKISELSTIIHMIHHKHDAEGTLDSDAHKIEVAHYRKQIDDLARGKNKKEVELRISHGREMANAALAHIKEKHGENAYPKRVGHTSKVGDIGKFTKGKHNDKQENPSDMMIEIGFKKHKKKGKK